jgi:hypothetical protein
MARPLKPGLDYFPLDISFDDNMELFEAECGLDGLAILIKLWQKIYSNGYYIEWNEDISLLFTRKINSEITKVNSVINVGLRRNLFSKFMYEHYHILTSSGIQKRYITACVGCKRRHIVFEKKYFLLDDHYKELITELIELIPEETELSPEVSTQRKGKEIERKREENNLFDEFWSAYPKKAGKAQAKKYWDKLISQKWKTEQLIECAINYSNLVKKEGREAKFIKQADGFLNPEKKMFEDYIGKLEQQRPSLLDMSIEDQFKQYE